MFTDTEQTDVATYSPTYLQSNLARMAEVPVALGFSSLIFAVLQNICAAIVGLDAFRVAIGVGSLVMTSGVGSRLLWFHSDWIRVPMIVGAVAGSLLNLYIVFHAQYLRSRPSAQWRQVPLTRQELRSQTLQIVLSVVTLSLVIFEECLHRFYEHNF